VNAFGSAAVEDRQLTVEAAAGEENSGVDLKEDAGRGVEAVP